MIFFGVVTGAYQTEYFAVVMRFIDPRIAASMFAILMAFTNIGQGIWMYLTGVLVDASFGRRLTIARKRPTLLLIRLCQTRFPA